MIPDFWFKRAGHRIEHSEASTSPIRERSTASAYATEDRLCGPRAYEPPWLSSYIARRIFVGNDVNLDDSSLINTRVPRSSPASTFTDHSLKNGLKKKDTTFSHGERPEYEPDQGTSHTRQVGTVSGRRSISARRSRRIDSPFQISEIDCSRRLPRTTSLRRSRQQLTTRPAKSTVTLTHGWWQRQ